MTSKEKYALLDKLGDVFLDGSVAEGRVVHDCFVLSNRAKAIYVQGKAAG